MRKNRTSLQDSAEDGYNMYGDSSSQSIVCAKKLMVRVQLTLNKPTMEGVMARLLAVIPSIVLVAWGLIPNGKIRPEYKMKS